MPKPMLGASLCDAQTLAKNAICLVSPSGEVIVTQLDAQSFPTNNQEAITLLQSHAAAKKQ